MVPLDAPPDTLQITVVSDVPVTLARNCCVPFAATEAVLGVTVTRINGGVFVLPPPPPQPVPESSEPHNAALNSQRQINTRGNLGEQRCGDRGKDREFHRLPSALFINSVRVPEWDPI